MTLLIGLQFNKSQISVSQKIKIYGVSIKLRFFINTSSYIYKKIYQWKLWMKRLFDTS